MITQSCIMIPYTGAPSAFCKIDSGNIIFLREAMLFERELFAKVICCKVYVCTLAYVVRRVYACM